MNEIDLEAKDVSVERDRRIHICDLEDWLHAMEFVRVDVRWIHRPH